ncbi:MAG TPA: GntR family transcriptional regulator [Solirubrobacteraceae bacterium]
MSFDLELRVGGHTPSAAKTAYDHVKERLLDGRYAGGTLLSENELARQLGISRTPVRQAFVQLEAEDLLELYPRRGALVRPISASEADDVLEARLLIEVHCVRRVVSYGAELASVLDRCLAEQERLLDEGGAAFTVADRAFHRTIVAANDNAILTRNYDALRDRLQRILSTAVARDPEVMARFVAEHREIAAAIVRGESRAADLLEAHLRRAHELARRPRP